MQIRELHFYPRTPYVQMVQQMIIRITVVHCKISFSFPIPLPVLSTKDTQIIMKQINNSNIIFPSSRFVSTGYIYIWIVLVKLAYIYSSYVASPSGYWLELEFLTTLIWLRQKKASFYQKILFPCYLGIKNASKHTWDINIKFQYNEQNSQMCGYQDRLVNRNTRILKIFTEHLQHFMPSYSLVLLW